jgi:hypothetical protein
MKANASEKRGSRFLVVRYKNYGYNHFDFLSETLLIAHDFSMFLCCFSFEDVIYCIVTLFHGAIMSALTVSRYHIASEPFVYHFCRGRILCLIFTVEICHHGSHSILVPRFVILYFLLCDSVAFFFTLFHSR